MLKPGKYLRSKNNGHIYPFDPRDLANESMEVVFLGEGGKPIEEHDLPGPPPPDEEHEEHEEEHPGDDDHPVSKMKRADLTELYIQKYGRKPHPNMRLPRLRQAVREMEEHGHDSSSDDR